MAQRENAYKTRLTKTLLEMFPGALILKNDAGFLQGVPDRLILFRDRWAALEAKSHEDAQVQPNQPYYVDLMNEMSFAAFIYPENEEDVLHELKSALRRY